MFERPEEKRSQPSEGRIRLGEEVAFDQSGKEALGQILRIMGRLSTAAGKSVERIPVDCAQFRQGLLLARSSIPRLQSLNHAPPCLGEDRDCRNAFHRAKLANWCWGYHQNRLIGMSSSVAEADKNCLLQPRGTLRKVCPREERLVTRGG